MSSITNPVGRFAPTPSGHLHFGSLLAATASYLDIKSQSGVWKLRIEDIDTPRVAPGSIDSILVTLESFGLHWDDSVYYSSQHRTDYLNALQQLKSSQTVFGCDCSRKQVFERHSEGIYQGYCRNREVQNPRAWRFKTPHTHIQLEDAIQASEDINLTELIGDFVVWRADDIPAYALTSIVDDYLQGVTQVVRGQDLYHASVAQNLLVEALQYPSKSYAHIPLAVNSETIKLSKRSRAPALDNAHPQKEILNAFAFLGLPVESTLNDASVDELWTWGIKHWSLSNVPKVAQLTSQVD